MDEAETHLIVGYRPTSHPKTFRKLVEYFVLHPDKIGSAVSSYKGTCWENDYQQAALRAREQLAKGGGVSRGKMAA